MTTELYKTNRPQDFDEVVGNEGVVRSLKDMVEKNKVPHAILFTGPSGCGKTTLARIVRNRLGCRESDFHEKNSSNFRGIDTIRDIESTMWLSPVASPCRVILLDEVHQLTKPAQEAALKMLEDMPKTVYFFLCTTDPSKLAKALRNRCTEMTVKPLTQAESNTLITRVVEDQNITVSQEVVDEIIDQSGGSARMMLVLLEKVSHLDDEKVQLAAVRSYDEAPTEVIDLCRALVKGDPWKKVGKLLQGLKGTDPESVRWAVLGYARAVLVKSGDWKAYNVITAFQDPFYESKDAGLAAACYEALHAQE